MKPRWLRDQSTAAHPSRLPGAPWRGLISRGAPRASGARLPVRGKDAPAPRHSRQPRPSRPVAAVAPTPTPPGPFCTVISRPAEARPVSGAARSGPDSEPRSSRLGAGRETDWAEPASPPAAAHEGGLRAPPRPAAGLGRPLERWALRAGELGRWATRRRGRRKPSTASGSAWWRRCRRTRGCCWTRCWRGACSTGPSTRRWTPCRTPSAGCAACFCWCRARARPPARSCCAVPSKPRARPTRPGTGSTWGPATGTAAMTPRAPATGRLRHLVPAAYALGYLELQTTMRLGVLKDRRPCNPGPQRSQSQKLKGLNRIWSQNQRQNQSRNWNQSRSRSLSPSRRLMSLKIPEGQSFPHPGLCWMGPDGMPAPKAGLTQLQVNKLQTVGLAWALPTTVLFAQALRAGGMQS